MGPGPASRRHLGRKILFLNRINRTTMEKNMEKKPRSAARIPARRSARANDVEKYLAAVPEPARSTLNKLRTIIRSALPPEATEGISYGMPAFKYKGPVAGIAAFPDHCSYFVMSGTLLDSFKDELKDYTVSKGGVQFPLEKPLPATLVKKLVKARMALNERKN
jgi:uncharacterized protein YdhG (YjbR/CyaY superfamily)